MVKKKGKKEKGRGAEKAAQKVAKKAKKDEEMGDLEAMIAEFQMIDRKKTEVCEEKCSAPSARINLSATIHPEKDEILFFGGEYFNGHKTYVYNDLHVYNMKKNEWNQLFVPNPPPPRCAHQAVAVPKDGGQLWIFGGEFASPTHSKFYHYKDLWVLHLSGKKWEKINAPGGPSPRSGHRMTCYKRQLIVFGGFHESSRDFIYFNDCYSFDLSEYIWCKLTPSGNGPSPRSGCHLMPLSTGVLVVGGYSKVRVKKDVDKGTAHADIFLLKPENAGSGKSTALVLKWAWSKVKDGGAKPSPRSAYGMTMIGGNRAVTFGGVHDEDEEEDIDSVFFNSMNCLDLDSFRWFPFELRKPKQTKTRRGNKKLEDAEHPSESNKDEESQEDLEQEADKEEIIEEDSKKPVVWVPCARMNPLLLAKRNTLYLYGGAFEEDEKQVTLNDLWSINLKTMDTWRELFEADDTSADWYESESNSSESEDEKMDEARGGEDEEKAYSDSHLKKDSKDSVPSSSKKVKHPGIHTDETYDAYWSRTSEYWLELMCNEADESIPADRINRAAKDMSAAWYKQQSKKLLQKLSDESVNQHIP